MKREAWMEKLYGKDWRSKPVPTKYARGQSPATPTTKTASTAKED